MICGERLGLCLAHYFTTHLDIVRAEYCTMW
jgi:hypothetical protein